MKEPKILSPRKLMKKEYGTIKYFLYYIGIYKVPQTTIDYHLINHKQDVWQKWIDWRWGNATMMAGSFDKMGKEHKFRTMTDCYNKGVKFGVSGDYIASVLSNNNFGYEIQNH